MPQMSPFAGTPIDRPDAECLAAVLKALADPARLRLLSLIQSTPCGEACVRDLTALLGLAQPTVSHHLRVLTRAGLLERDKRGIWTYYRLAPAAIATIARLLTRRNPRRPRNAGQGQPAERPPTLAPRRGAISIRDPKQSSGVGR